MYLENNTAMTELQCSKCGKSAPGLAEAPFNNDLGTRVFNHVCQTCWQEWLRMQLMIMNEYRLHPLNEEHSKFLDEQMQVFLNLP